MEPFPAIALVIDDFSLQQSAELQEPGPGISQIIGPVLGGRRTVQVAGDPEARPVTVEIGDGSLAIRHTGPGRAGTIISYGDSGQLSEPVDLTGSGALSAFDLEALAVPTRTLIRFGVRSANSALFIGFMVLEEPRVHRVRFDQFFINPFDSGTAPDFSAIDFLNVIIDAQVGAPAGSVLVLQGPLQTVPEPAIYRLVPLCIAVLLARRECGRGDCSRPVVRGRLRAARRHIDRLSRADPAAFCKLILRALR